MAILSIVATPIGNLEDITLRALRTLKEADVILCEDTRHTKNLLDAYDISYEKLLSYHAQSGLAKSEKIIALLEEGKHLALVSDAGTPTISDPGSRLVHEVRDALGSAVEIIPIPGPSAAIAALSMSGFASSEFLFLGFLPHKKGRETLFAEIAQSERTTVFYESPHRIMKTLERLRDILADNRVVGIARELTKIHEEFFSGTPEAVYEHFHKKDRIRGEFVVLVSGK